MGQSQILKLVNLIQLNQVRHYGKVRMPDNLLLRVQKVHKPAVMKSNIENLNKEEQIIEKRKLWAKFGSKSGYDIDSILPTHKEISNEAKKEKEWWPTLEEIQNEYQTLANLKQQYEDEKSRKILLNMAKMPQWIKEFEEEKIKQQSMPKKAAPVIKTKLTPENINKWNKRQIARRK